MQEAEGGHAMTELVLALIVEDKVQTQASPCGICGG
jgi:hypothetical protein